jgi:glyoxylase-like metal-dependent hydrolase (beta-lactamase superfamily II)
VLHTLNAYDTLYVLAGGGENAVALMRDDGVVLIDPLPFGWGKASTAAIEAVSDRPVKTIINIRASEDHLKANTEYPMATKIIAHQSVAARARRMAAFAGANAKFLPSTTVADRLTLFEGPDELRVYAYGPAVTDGDLVVFFSAKGTAYLGPLYPSKSTPSTIDATRGGSPSGLVQALAKIRSDLKDVRQVIAGNEAPKTVELGKAGSAMPISATPSWKDFEEYAERAAAVYASAVK